MFAIFDIPSLRAHTFPCKKKKSNSLAGSPEPTCHSQSKNKRLKCPPTNTEETPTGQTSTTEGLNKAFGEGDVSFKAKERNLSECRSGVTGALLISSQINSQLFPLNKGSQGGNQPPPRARWSASRDPPVPLQPFPSLSLSDGVCACSRWHGPPGSSSNQTWGMLLESILRGCSVWQVSRCHTANEAFRYIFCKYFKEFMSHPGPHFGQF